MWGLEVPQGRWTHRALVKGWSTIGTRLKVTMCRHAALCANPNGMRVRRKDDMMSTTRSYPHKEVRVKEFTEGECLQGQSGPGTASF